MKKKNSKTLYPRAQSHFDHFNTYALKSHSTNIQNLTYVMILGHFTFSIAFFL